MSWPPPGSSQPPRSSIPPLGAQGQQPQGQSYVGPPGLQYPWYPPPKGGGLKWVILGVVALGAVIAVAVAVTVVVLHSNSGGGSKDSTASSSGPASGIASANDKGPVAVITEDPTCTAWTSIQTAIADRERNGWDKRDPSIPATAWTAEQRAQYEAVGRAMRNAADQTVALVKRTPHRVMRELYEQSIAYWRAYADHIANYSPRDENLAHTANDASSGVGTICTAVTNGSAVEWGSQVASAAPPSRLTPPGDPANPQRFLTSSNPVCGEWDTTLAQLDADTTEWRGIDGNIPASQWSPEQAKINRDMAPVMSRAAGKLEQLGVRSGNPTLEDFAVLSAQYRRALVQSLPSYIAADNQLSEAANYLESTVLSACQAVGG